MRTMILAALLVLVACSPDSPASWRDDPASNEYGPKTAVVWVDGLNAETYHRLLCPVLRASDLKPIPKARRALEDWQLPCGVCEP